MANDEIQKAFNDVSTALDVLEQLITKEAGAPSADLNLDSYNRIRFPKYYIRTREYYSKSFGLVALISDTRLRDSICYALMQSDVHRYVIHRFNLYSIVNRIFLKMAIVNLVSIIEAIMIGVMKNLHSFCTNGGVVCKYNSTCPVYIKSVNNIKTTQLLRVYEERIGIAVTGDTIYNDIEKLFDIRNKVHLSIIDVHEFISSDYTIINYKAGQRVIRYLKDNLSELTARFEVKRSENCRVALEVSPAIKKM